MFYRIIKISLFMIISINRIVASSDDSDSYLLKTGKEAIEHLEQQQKFLAKYSYEQLTKAKLKEGQTIWDIGCGTGIMTEYLAKTVGPRGHVYAMDISPKQLEVVKERMQKKGIKNVTYVVGDISTYDKNLYPKADLVYSRLLLMHLRQPLAALKHMNSLLKVNGIISLQESIIETARVYPHSKAVERYVEILIALAKSKGTNYNIGNKLAKLSEEAGFCKLDSYIVAHKLPLDHEYKNRLIKKLEDIRPQLIEAEISDPQEIEGLINDISLIPENNKEAYIKGGDQGHYIGIKN